MRNRLITIYSEDDFNEQMKSEKDPKQINSTFYAIRNKGTAIINIDKIASNEEKLLSFINELNINYSKNILVKAETSIEICSFLKDIILNEQALFYNRRSRKKIHTHHHAHSLSYREVINCIIENDLNSVIQKNTSPLYTLTISLISYIDLIDFHTKNKILYHFLEKEDQLSKASSSYSTMHKFQIFKSNIIDPFDNKLTCIKVFDFCNMDSTILNIYIQLSQIVVFIFSGGNEEESISVINQYTPENKSLIVIELDPCSDVLEMFCKENNFAYFNNAASAMKYQIISKLFFLKKNISKNSQYNNEEDNSDASSSSSYSSSQSNDSDGEDVVDNLSRGMEYYCIDSFKEDSNTNNNNFIMKQRLSFDSHLLMRKTAV